jgi:hypothetical protein
MPVRRMTNLAGLTVAVVLVLWSLLIFAPSNSTRRNLAPESLFSTAHRTALGSENEALSINDAFIEENLGIEGRDARALDAYGEYDTQFKANFPTSSRILCGKK